MCSTKQRCAPLPGSDRHTAFFGLNLPMIAAGRCTGRHILSEVQVSYNVSGVEPSDSDYRCTLILFYYRLLQDIEYTC